MTVDQHRWRSDVRVVPFVSRPDAPISTRATYVVEDRNRTCTSPEHAPGRRSADRLPGSIHRQQH
ncbi:hypothetical protein ACFPJ1_38135 [Kribbella qitaiheensis]|uniref:hypothetical protein n=1 Tax=Kribbella qitaiheensis TaxID=1544730 RepID=UPI00360F4E59